MWRCLGPSVRDDRVKKCESAHFWCCCYFFLYVWVGMGSERVWMGNCTPLPTIYCDPTSSVNEPLGCSLSLLAHTCHSARLLSRAPLYYSHFTLTNSVHRLTLSPRSHPLVTIEILEDVFSLWSRLTGTIAIIDFSKNTPNVKVAANPITKSNRIVGDAIGI